MSATNRAAGKAFRILNVALPLALVAGLGFMAFRPATTTAALQANARAPQFVTQGAIGGKMFTLDLRKQLAKGPVVLYFFPKAFTKGCTLETAAFAENHDRFAAAGATVIGMSADNIADLQRFSTEVCRSKFPVAIATPRIMQAYDVKLPAVNMTNRTSFVIARDGRIAYVHSDMNYVDHVRNTLAAVERLKPRPARR